MLILSTDLFHPLHIHLFQKNKIYYKTKFTYKLKLCLTKSSKTAQRLPNEFNNPEPPLNKVRPMLRNEST